MKVSRDVNLLISNPIVCEGNAYTTTTKSKGAEKLNDNLTIDNDSIAPCISIQRAFVFSFPYLKHVGPDGVPHLRHICGRAWNASVRVQYWSHQCTTRGDFSFEKQT